MSFSGKAAFVTGAGGGMGLQISCDMIAAGADVLMLDVKPPPSEIAAGPGRHLYVQADATDEAAVAGAVDQALDAFGGLDYLANVAGVLWFGRDTSALEVDLDLWDRVMAINLKAMVLTARYLVPAMKARGGGAMVHFSSTQCLRGDTRPQDAYQASKAGVLALSKSLALQLAEFAIRSNAIIPGPVLSPLQARWQDDPAAKEAAAAAVPLGRLGRPQDLADACLFLLSDKAAYITGTELLVDGGLMARP